MLSRLRRAERHHLALIGIALVVILVFAVNLLANAAITSARLDLTEDGLYTLAEGTKETLAGIEEPIDIRFYYSSALDEAGGPYFANHARRVDELLAEYERLSGGMVRIERLDPQPFSREEDLAVAEGLRGLPLSDDGTQAYFGLSGRNATDDLEVIPYLAPERGDFLEYDLTRLVYDLAAPEKPVVAILGDLPLMGEQANQFEPWLVLEAMFQFFEVRFLGGRQPTIAADVDVLMLAQPQGLDEDTLYAIDQFAMRGGRILALVDPFAESLVRGQNPMANQGNAVELMEPLLAAWGVEVANGEVVGDAQLAQRVRAPVRGREAIVQFLPWIALGPPQIAGDDVVTAQLERINLQSAGWIAAREGATTTFEPLLRSSPEAGPIPAAELEAEPPDPAALIEAFAPRGEPYVLAARITGAVRSAFPDGPPAADEAEGDAAAAPEEEGAEDESARPHLAEAEAPLNLVLIADSDFLADHNWMRRQELLGQQFSVPIAHNADMVVNALDHLGGSQGLIGLRGRGLSVRPFEVVEAMEREAETNFRAKEEELLARIEEAQEKIRALQQEDQGGGVILTAEQQQEIEGFRAEMLRLREELRGVQRSLREDVETLSFWVRAINIWAVPALVALLAVGLALIRRRRAARYAAHA